MTPLNLCPCCGSTSGDLSTGCSVCGYRSIITPEPNNPLEAFLNRQIPWSTKTFGSGKRMGGITKHIEKEVAEVRAKPDDLTEWIDIIILAIDGYWRHGGKPETITRDLEAKQAKNFGREYPRPISEDEPSEHVRPKPSKPAPEGKGEKG